MSINRFSFALNAAENERFLVRKGVDMQAVLRALASRHQPIALYFGDKDDVLDAELIAINPAYEELIFTTGNDPAPLERLLAAGSFGVETALDSIRILFIATHAEMTQFKGERALRARIPETIARMQRRESVRVALPLDRSAYCTLKLGGEPPAEVRLQVHDVSLGGLGLVAPAKGRLLDSGKTINDCSLDLPGIGVMRCALKIVYVSEPLPEASDTRYGCHFVALPALSREQIRSYVARLERAKLAGG